MISKLLNIFNALPILLTVIPFLFAPVLERLKNWKDSEDGRVLLRKTALLSKYILECAFYVYIFCRQAYQGKTADIAEIERVIGWTKESSSNFDNKLKSMGDELQLSNSPIYFGNVNDKNFKLNQLSEFVDHVASTKEVQIKDSDFEQLFAEVVLDNEILHERIALLSNETEVNKKLVELETALVVLKEENEKLVEENNDLKTTLIGVEELEKQNDGYKKQIEFLEAELAENSRLETKFATQEKDARPTGTVKD